MIGALIGAGVGLASSIVGGLFGKSQQNSANKANLLLAREQNDWNEKMWEKNNEYNSPVAQKQRLIEAGINPLGQNFTNFESDPVESAPLANQQAYVPDPNFLTNGITSTVNAVNQSRLAEAERDKIYSDIAGSNVKKAIDEKILKNLDREQDDEHAIKWAQINLFRAQELLAGEQKDFTWTQNYYYPHTVGASTALQNSETDLNKQEYDFRKENNPIRHLITVQELANLGQTYNLLVEQTGEAAAKKWLAEWYNNYYAENGSSPDAPVSVSGSFQNPAFGGSVTISGPRGQYSHYIDELAKLLRNMKKGK